MPRETAEYLQRQLEQPDFMVPASATDVNGLAIIHALRTAADGMKRLADQQDRSDSKLDTVLEKINDTNTRLTVIEKSDIGLLLKDHEVRLSLLEDERQRRVGAIGLWDFVLKSWPAILAFAALIALLTATGTIG